MAFPRSVFGGWRVSTANCYHSMGGYHLPPALSPPPLRDFCFLRAATPLQLFHNSAAASKEKGKAAAGRRGGFQQKSYLLLCPWSKRVMLAAGRVVDCRWDQ